MDQVEPQVGSWHPTTRTLAWPTYPQTPSGGGQRADPGQKHEPGGTDDSRGEGIDNPPLVTEAQLPFFLSDFDASKLFAWANALRLLEWRR
jgi:hypothetical protein